MRATLSRVAFALVLVSLLLFLDRSNAEAGCTTYENSKVVQFGGEYGAACASTGPGCNECVTTATRGAKVCYWVDFNDIYCIYVGQYPDNQM